MLAPLLRSEVQGKLLAELFVDPDAEHTVTSLAARAGTSVPTAIREVDRAEAARIVRSRRLGNTRLVRVDPDNPLYGAVREIVLATYGAPAVLNQELAGIPGIEQLFIFGSFAARYLGEPGRPPNDVDVLVIGEPERGAVYEAAERAERRLARPVRLTMRSRREWDEPDAFLREVKSSPLLALLEANEHT